MSVEESDVIKRSLELQKRKDDFIRKCQMERVQQEEAELEMAQKARKRFYHECPFEKEAEKPIWDENGSLIQYIERKSNKYVPRSEEEDAPEPPKQEARQKTQKQRKQRRRIKKRVRKVKPAPEGNEREEAQNEENKNDEHEEAQKEENEENKNDEHEEEKKEHEEEEKKEDGEKSSEYEYEYEEEEEEEEETEEELERRKRIDAHKDFMKRNATFDKTEKKVRISKRIHHVSKEFLKRQRKAAQRRNTPKVEEQVTVFTYRSPRSKALSKNKTYKSRDRQVEEKYSFRPDIGASKNYPTRGLPVEEAAAHIFLKDLDRQGRSLEMQIEEERECTFHPVFEGSPAYRERLAKRSEQRQKAKLEALQKEKEAARSKQ